MSKCSGIYSSYHNTDIPISGQPIEVIRILHKHRNFENNILDAVYRKIRLYTSQKKAKSS